MDSFLFHIIPNCYQDASKYDSNLFDFLIEEDNWNDFNYYTTYHIHATSKITNGGTRYLGDINFMHKGQCEGEKEVLTTFYRDKKMTFSQLDKNFCSISFSIEIFSFLSKIYEKKDRELFQQSLNLIISEDSPIYKEFKDEPCFNTSFLRFGDSFALKKIKQLILDEGVFYELEKQKISINYRRKKVNINLDFSGIAVKDNSYLPYGMIAFVGHNGCGKSTLLYQLARVLYASPTYRNFYSDDIEICPSNIGISKLLVFSYSTFDNFELPGATLSEKKLILNDWKHKQGRFVFCGVRDAQKELQEEVDTAIDGKLNQKFFNHLRTRDISLKGIDGLAEEFSNALINIDTDKDKSQLWNNVINKSENILPELYNDIKIFRHSLFGNQTKETYLTLSTGIKFFLHAISHIIAYTEDNSLLLFDEPENHLHPPLLSFMMTEIRNLIHHYHSVMLVATHSPVILQELFSKNVYVLRRLGDTLFVKQPKTETYGESFGYINSMVYNLTSDITSFHDAFDALYEEWKCDNLPNIEAVIRRFEDRLECTSLSNQMTAYLINKYMLNH